MADNSISLLFRARGDTSDAVDAFKKLKESIGNDLAQMKADGESVFSGLVLSTATLTAGVSALAVGMAAAVGVMFRLAQGAEEVGSKIYDASQKTGLGAEAISALKVAADQSGSSLEAISGSVAKFSTLVGQAANGSAKAQAVLIKYGIEPKAAVNDLSGALDKAFLAISALETPALKAAAAQALFKDRTGEILPVIEQAGGDLAKFREECKRLGLTITDEAAAAADRFGDQLNTLGKQVGMLKVKIGQELIPTFNEFAHDVSEWLVKNKGEVKGWGEEFAKALRLSGLEVEKSKNDIDGMVNSIKLLVAYGGGAYGGFAYGKDIGAITANAERIGLEGTRIQIAQNNAGQPSNSAQADDYADWKAGKLPFSKGDVDVTAPTSKSPKALKDIFKLSSQGQALVDAATKLGVSPLDLATIIGFETGGSYSPSTTNKQGYRGLMQFGAAEQSKYGVTKGQSFESQVAGPVVQFLKDRFASVGKSTEGADLLTLYRTVLGGNPNASLTGTDANGTSPLSGVAKMYRNHRPQALKRFFGDDPKNVQDSGVGGDIAAANEKAQREAEDEFKAFELAENRKLTLRKSTTDGMIEQDERLYKRAVELATPQYAIDAAQRIHDAKIALVNDEIATLEKEYDKSDKSSKDADALEQAILVKRIERQRIIGAADAELEQKRKEIEAAEEARREKQRKFWKEASDAFDEKLRQIQAEGDAIQQQQEDAAFRKNRQAELDGTVTQGGGIGQGMAGSLGVNLVSIFDPENMAKLKTGAAFIKDVFKDIKLSIGGAIGEITRGFGQMLAQAIITGKFSGAAFLGMVAQITLGLAIESGIKAIFELAEGYAALANPFLAWTAPAHFAAAGHYAVVAAVAGGVGVVSALGARALSPPSSAGYGAAGSPQSNGRTGGGVTQYSGQPDVIKEGGINAAMPAVRIDLGIRLDSHGVLQVVHDDIKSNGRLRTTIQDAAAA